MPRAIPATPSPRWSVTCGPASWRCSRRRGPRAARARRGKTPPERGCSAATRNQRLAVIKSFCVTPVRDLRQWENGGYFVLRPEIFDYLNEGEDLVEDALPRLIAERKVIAYPHKGYWSPADMVKERAQLEEMYHRGHCPWMIWDPERSGQSKESWPASGQAAAAQP